MKKILLNSCLTVLLAVSLVSEALAGINIPSISPLVKQVGSAVVNISTERMVKNQFGALPGMPKEFQDFFEQFGPFMGPQGDGKERLQSALGTGFIISGDGYIVTNNHVVKNADKIYVTLAEQNNKQDKVEAKVIGSDSETDLALNSAILIKWKLATGSLPLVTPLVSAIPLQQVLSVQRAVTFTQVPMITFCRPMLPLTPATPAVRSSI